MTDLSSVFSSSVAGANADSVVKKPSIFVCKTCKSNTVEVEKKPKQVKEKPEILQVKLEPAKQKDSKYSVKIEGGKTVSFGQKSASDYTINKDKDRRQLYITRHQKREEQFWSPEQENLQTASFWSRFLLWGDHEDIFENIKDIEKRMGCEIKFTKNTIEKHQRKLARLAKALKEDEE